MEQEKNSRIEKLMNSGLPNFITMQNMNKDEQIVLLDKVVAKGRKEYIQRIKQEESAKRTRALKEGKRYECSYKDFWI